MEIARIVRLNCSSDFRPLRPVSTKRDLRFAGIVHAYSGSSLLVHSPNLNACGNRATSRKSRDKSQIAFGGNSA
jgi:hypothetical protein